MLARKARTFPMSRSKEILLTEFLGNNQPIIMISSSPTALVTMHNVKRFLEEATYVILIVYHLSVVEVC
jgi:RNA pol II accessory factor, Cdc73 family, C-terminal